MTRRPQRPFLERVRTDRKTGELVEELPLAERFPDYLKAFGVGMAVTGTVALALWLLTSLRIEHAFGYTWIATGTVLLLVGGARGGGYTNMSIGAVEALVGGRNRTDDDLDDDDDVRKGGVMKRRDPMARLRKGLRPPPNPTAFWQAIAGFVFIAIGLPLTF